jgi:hypothetical protein
MAEDSPKKDTPAELSPYFIRPSRRDLITRLGAAAGVLAGSSLIGKAVWDHKGSFEQAQLSGVRQVRDYRLKDGQPGPAEFAELAIARAKVGDVAQSTLAETLVARAVDAMGGMKRFISRGDVVVVKPNIGWDRMPIHAANTNPDVVAAVVKQAYDAGAKRVIVADGSCNDPSRCFQRSGIWKAAYAMGADRSPCGASLSHHAP